MWWSLMTEGDLRTRDSVAHPDPDLSAVRVEEQ